MLPGTEGPAELILGVTKKFINTEGLPRSTAELAGEVEE